MLPHQEEKKSEFGNFYSSTLDISNTYSFKKKYIYLNVLHRRNLFSSKTTESRTVFWTGCVSKENYHFGVDL